MTSSTPLSLSFEFFPPKTPEGHLHLAQAAHELAHYQPDFFSVTFGACGSTRLGTQDVTRLLQTKTQIAVSPHLSCIGLTKTDISAILTEYNDLNIQRIIAIRGDSPHTTLPSSDFAFATDLVHYIRQQTNSNLHITVAAYPEIHPSANNAITDIKNLKHKADVGANSAITQYFYNADNYFYFLEECAKYGITIPIIPGIMPITTFAKLVRFSASCGAEIPRWILKRLEVYQADDAALQDFATDLVYRLCERLLKGGAPGLHFYSLNQASAIIAILTQLGITIDQRALTKGNQVR